MSTATREEINLGGITVRFLIEGNASNGSVAVFEFDVRAGRARCRRPTATTATRRRSTASEHAHLDCLTARRSRVGEGEVLCIPRGVVHRFENTGDVDATVLAVVTPGILGPRLLPRARSSGRRRRQRAHPIRAPIGAIMLRHGLTPARPPASS